MTTYEHAMLGITGALAAGLHRRHGWQIVAMAGVAAVLPDWDGLSLSWGPAAFDRCHRAWGHNVFVAPVLGAATAIFCWGFRPFDRLARLSTKGQRAAEQQSGSQEVSAREVLLWIFTGVVASLSHLAADLVFSGSRDLSDWELQLLWPITSRGWVYPLVPWGDVGTTLIFIAGMFAMARFRRQVRPIACGTLVAVVAYIVIRGLIGR